MRRLALVCLVFAVAALLAAPEASAAKKKAKATPPAKQTAPYVTIPDSNLGKLLLKSGKVAPVKPVRRDSGLTTIAPYPVPYDTSRDAAERGRIMNVPKSGETVLVPMQQDELTVEEAKEPTPDSTTVPKWGEPVYATDGPEVIVSVQPKYPAEARAKGIQGTVIVKALVLKDGRVGEAHASEPLPYLDRAAEACIRQWRFKPAMNGSMRIAVWIAIPVKFTLH